MERIKEYSDSPTEAPWVARTAPIGWPRSGTITIKKYSTRYRPGLNLVIKDLTADIMEHEKIGIVGRTGAGKIFK